MNRTHRHVRRIRLLAAIFAHPDEDTPRLMYADWLQENGQPERAEFIRLQCAVDADEAAEARAADLEQRNRGKWLRGFPQFATARWGFRRGFPEYLAVPGHLFLERYEAFNRVRWLRFLSLDDVVSLTVRDFGSRPWNPRWVELELQEHPMVAIATRYKSTPAIVAIANCAQMRQLRQLQLSLFDLTTEGIHALVTSAHLEDLPQLRLLGYSDNPLFAPLRERFGDRLVIG